jgi:hypothetical protein
MTGPAVEASAFKNLVIRNNIIVNKGKAPVVLKMRGSIRAESGTGLWVEGNDWTTQKGIDPPGLFYDKETAQKVACGSNLLKNE